jgi:hypothetical protein
MTRPDAESPLASAAGAAGPHVVDRLKRVGDETRLAILVALWEAYDPFAEQNALPFSDLLDRVNYDTSGNFSYHLDKLEGHFLESTADGYRLTQAGHRLVRAIIAGTGLSDRSLPPTTIDHDCVLCGEPLAITYEAGQLYTVCTACEGRFPSDETPPGTIMGFAFGPAGLSRPSAEAIFAASVHRAIGKFTMQMGGLCPECSGPVERSIHVCETHDPDTDPDSDSESVTGAACPHCGRPDELQARWVCTVCKNAGHGPPGPNLVLHPRVVAFYADHGLEIGYDATDFESIVRMLTAMADHRQELLSTDPVRIRVTIRYAGDELRLLVDETMSVVAEE